MSVRHRLSERAPSVLLVSVADKLHNIRALLRDYRAVEEAFWIRFNPEAGGERARSVTIADSPPPTVGGLNRFRMRVCEC
jgi:hypothetical protein